MSNSILTKGYIASSNLDPHRVVTLNSANQLVLSQAITDLTIGVTSELSATTGKITDVLHIGIASVKLSGTVVAGSALSPSTNGTAKAAGSSGRIIGIALGAGVNGDLIPVLLSPSQV